MGFAPPRGGNAVERGAPTRRGRAHDAAPAQANREDLRNQTHAAPPAPTPKAEDDDEDAGPRLIIASHEFSAAQANYVALRHPENPRAPIFYKDATPRAALCQVRRPRRGREPRRGRARQNRVVFSGRGESSSRSSRRGPGGRRSLSKC